MAMEKEKMLGTFIAISEFEGMRRRERNYTHNQSCDSLTRITFQAYVVVDEISLN